MVLTHAVDVAGPTELLGVLFTRLGLALSISSSIFDPTTEVIRGWVMSRGSRSSAQSVLRDDRTLRSALNSERISLGAPQVACRQCKFIGQHIAV